MSQIRQHKRYVMQPLGNMNNVARRPSVANRGQQNIDTQGHCDESLSNLDGDAAWSGTDRHIVQLATNNEDISFAEVSDAIDFAEHQAASWTDLDVWD